MSSQFVKRALEHVNNSYEVSAYPVGDARRLDEFAREHGADRRYKIHLRAMSGNVDRISSALVTYRGVKYYAYHDAPIGEFVVQLDR